MKLTAQTQAPCDHLLTINRDVYSVTYCVLLLDCLGLSGLFEIGSVGVYDEVCATCGEEQ